MMDICLVMKGTSSHVTDGEVTGGILAKPLSIPVAGNEQTIKEISKKLKAKGI